MNSVITKIIKIKKKFFPTQYDKEQKKLHSNRLSFYKQFINHGDLCFDVGANIGNRTEIFLELGAKVIAVEPQRSCNEILEHKFGDKITLIKKGVGSKSEIKDFFISNENQVSTFSKDWIDTLKKDRFKDTEWNDVEQIEIVTLDSLIPNSLIPAFIKIDVEGFELEVLKGLNKQFKYLSFEFAVPENFVGLKSCLSQLAGSYITCQFNYAVQDNTYLELNKWLNYDEFLVEINKESFQKLFAGDVYVKCLN